MTKETVKNILIKIIVLINFGLLNALPMYWVGDFPRAGDDTAAVMFYTGLICAICYIVTAVTECRNLPTVEKYEIKAHLKITALKVFCISSLLVLPAIIFIAGIFYFMGYVGNFAAKVSLCAAACICLSVGFMLACIGKNWKKKAIGNMIVIYVISLAVIVLLDYITREKSTKYMIWGGISAGSALILGIIWLIKMKNHKHNLPTTAA
jgi:hypothetical protein